MAASDLFEKFPVFDPTQWGADQYAEWEQAGEFIPQGEGAPYCIMIPPPNVTGTLHMGHAFQNTLMDILIRHARMQGRRTLWQVGTDHAGIATQIVVERQLEQAGTSRQALGREAFVERVWSWKAQSGGTIAQQLRRLGVSVDWTRERFTLDAGLQEAVQTAFIRLFEAGLIEKRQRLVSWDPVLQTALSDLEVVTQEQPGFLYQIRYPLADDPSQGLVVATTRPETLFGDQAVAVHPEDPRYAAWIGRTLRLPLTDRVIPIIADPHVEPDFGTGCLKITPAHDPHDYEIGQRHGLTPLNILHPNGTLNTEVPPAFQGLSVLQARQMVIQALKAHGYWEGETPHTQQIPISEKNGTVLEPYLTEQWYLKMRDLADRALEAVATGQVAFIPDNWRHTYNNWLDEIQDWCISRQLWWGHRIPIWTDPAGRAYAGRDEASIRATHQISPDVPLVQDPDVLDTWFSSALWPFSTLGWPHQTPDLATFYPTQVLITGFDIIFFWVARMIMLGLYFTGQVPFRTVYIHGLVCDHAGQKMSKSKGNVLDPIDLIDGIDQESLVAKRTQNLMHPKMAPQIAQATRTHFPQGIKAHGVDPLRFTFAALASHSRKINFDMGRLEGYRNFCNKIWNAARFLDMKLADQRASGPLPFPVAEGFCPEDTLWERALWTRLQQLVEEINTALSSCRFDTAALAVYDFIWGYYCDWFVEIAKIRLADPSSLPDQGIRLAAHLLHAFEHILRIAHPFMPFITDVLWNHLRPQLQGIHQRPYSDQPVTRIVHAPYPDPDQLPTDPTAYAQATWIEGCIRAIRALRSATGISPATQLTLWIRSPVTTETALENMTQAIFQAQAPFVQGLCRLSEIHYGVVGNPNPPVPTLHGFFQGWELLLGVPDHHVQGEINRLASLVQKLETAIRPLEKKLAQAAFVERAPAEVVAEERNRLADLIQQRSVAQNQYHHLTSGGNTPS